MVKSLYFESSSMGYRLKYLSSAFKVMSILVKFGRVTIYGRHQNPKTFSQGDVYEKIELADGSRHNRTNLSGLFRLLYPS